MLTEWLNSGLLWFVYLCLSAIKCNIIYFHKKKKIADLKYLLYITHNPKWF